MAKRGRPLKLTVTKQEEFCELIDAGLSRSEAARMIGCVPSAISKALDSDPAFRKRLRRTERARERLRLDGLYILAPKRKRQAVRRLVDSYRGIIQPGPENRKLGHRLTRVLYRLAAAQLRPYLEE